MEESEYSEGTTILKGDDCNSQYMDQDVLGQRDNTVTSVVTENSESEKSKRTKYNDNNTFIEQPTNLYERRREDIIQQDYIRETVLSGDWVCLRAL